MFASDAISVVALAIEAGVILLLLTNRLWRTYPLFSVYAVWLFVGNSVLFAFSHYLSAAAYAGLYWKIDTLDVALRFVVVWEVFHQTFPRNSGLSKSLSKGLGIAAFSLVVFAGATFWGFQNYTSAGSLHLALDRSFGFVQALMILGTLVMARYYGVTYGRNIRGIALAFGAWVSVSTANNAMVDLTHSFLPYWRYLRPLTFVMMMAVWFWALWVYDPNPPIIESEVGELDRWTQDWNRTISTARTIIRP